MNHGNQEKEHRVYQWALRKNSSAAIQATSFGALQIMGFHYRAMGYKKPQDLVHDLQMSRERQLDVLFRSITGYKYKAAGPYTFLQAVQKKEYWWIARICNGDTSSRYAADFKGSLDQIKRNKW